MKDATDRYDVAVVGGGPAGAVAARTLGRRGRRVLLVEASRFDGWRLGETLFPSIREPLAALGVADGFEDLPAVPSNGIRSCWGTPEPEARSFVTSPYGTGWHVDRTAFDRFLVDAARRVGVTVALGTRATRCEFAATGRTATLALDPVEDGGPQSGTTPESVGVDGVIDATGRTATVARWLSGERAAHDALVAAAARYRAPSEQCGRYTLIEATGDGWWYSAPLPDERVVVAWFTDGDLVGDRHEPEQWRDELAETTRTAARVADGSFERGPVVAGAVSHRLRRPLGADRWLAVAMDDWLDGGREGVEQYESDVDAEFDAYRKRWRSYYALEGRWSDRPFWRRRHDAGDG
jgi:flavin-dependent dehydrogenase